MSNKPKAVALIGTCNHCKESLEFAIPKKKIRELYKQFKGSSKIAVGVRGECSRCGKKGILVVTKKMMKGIIRGFHENSTTKAETVSEQFIDR